MRKIPSLLSLLLGSLVNKLDEKHIHYLIIAAPLITSIFMSLLGVVPSYPILLLLLLLVGFSSSLFHILAPTIIKKVIGAAVALGLFPIVDGWLLLPLLIILGFCIFAINPIILALVLTKNYQQLIKMNSFYKTIGFISTAAATLIIGQGADVLGLDLIYKVLPFTLLLSLGLILKIEN